MESVDTSQESESLDQGTNDETSSDYEVTTSTTQVYMTATISSVLRT